MGLVTKEAFLKRLRVAKVKALQFSEKKLDRIISNEWKKRLKVYNSCSWSIGWVNINELGVWRRAGGLPLSWTDASLKKTAQKVKNALDKNPKLLIKRARYAIPNILQTNVNLLQKEKYLFPIVFMGGIGTKGRKRLKHKTKYDIDDGCMRSIALAMSEYKSIKVYIGSPKKI